MGNLRNETPLEDPDLFLFIKKELVHIAVEVDKKFKVKEIENWIYTRTLPKNGKS